MSSAFLYATFDRRAVKSAQGLDPNVWFRNVEYVAAKEIGHETVSTSATSKILSCLRQVVAVKQKKKRQPSDVELFNLRFRFNLPASVSFFCVYCQL
jgi:hypothetical protein